MRDTTLNKTAAMLREQERHQLGGPPHPAVRLFATIVTINADTLVVNIGGGATVEVIKPAKVCPAMDKNVDGFTYDYSGDPTEKQSRTSTSGTTETQVVVPRFIIGDLVEVGPAPSNVADHAASLSAFTLQVVNSPAYWAKESVS